MGECERLAGGGRPPRDGIAWDLNFSIASDTEVQTEPFFLMSPLTHPQSTKKTSKEGLAV